MFVLHWNIPCSWSDSTLSVLSCYGVSNKFRSKQGPWRFLRAVEILLTHLNDTFILYWRAHFSMALGFQWTKYCSWDAGICQSPWTLAFFWADLLPVSYFANVVAKTHTSGLKLWEFPACLLIVLHTLSCIARARMWSAGYMMDKSYDPFLPLHQTLVLHIRSVSFGS